MSTHPAGCPEEAADRHTAPAAAAGTADGRGAAPGEAARGEAPPRAGSAAPAGIGAWLGRALGMASRLRERLIGLWIPEAEAAARALALTRAYWRADPSEKARLTAREQLSWPETLRLFHLACAELWEARRAAPPPGSPDAQDAPLDDPGRPGAQAGSGPADTAGVADAGHPPSSPTPAVDPLAPLDLAPPGEALELCRDLAERLSERRSPYLPRALTVWRRGQGPLPRPADLEATFQNASVTHQGALEVLRLDERGVPIELAFVALADLAGVELGEPARFRAACLHYEAPRERPEPGSQAALASEVVLLPTRYGIDAADSTPAEPARGARRSATPGTPDGSLAGPGLRLAACFDDAYPPRGLGIGRQALIADTPTPADPGREPSGADAAVSGARPGAAAARLVHLDEIDGFLVTVDLDDPRFDVKCRTRGVDPREVREALVFGKKPKT